MVILYCFDNSTLVDRDFLDPFFPHPIFPSFATKKPNRKTDNFTNKYEIAHRVTVGET